MINVSSLGILYGLMSRLLFFGVSKGYGYEVIEQRIARSSFIAELEDSSDELLYRIHIDDFVTEIYPSEGGEVFDYSQTNALFLWMGEAYFRLFFKHHKSMAYVFLYLPIKDMIGLFDLYHEQDWDQLHRYFVGLTEETTLLRKLMKKRGITANKLAELSGVGLATINHYREADRFLYEGKFPFIDAIAHVLKVHTNMFLKEIHNYTYSGSFEFDRHNHLYRSYLGFHYCRYYVASLKKRKYVYSPDLGYFESPEGILKVRWTDGDGEGEVSSTENPQIEAIVKEESDGMVPAERRKTILVIFEFNQTSDDPKSYRNLRAYDFERIVIINQQCVLSIGSDYWISYITESINGHLVAKAKKDSGGDFAL